MVTNIYLNNLFRYGEKPITYGSIVDEIKVNKVFKNIKTFLKI